MMSCTRSTRCRTRPTRGPAATSWGEVTVRAVSDKVVTFTLKTPLGGFLQALTQPIAPAHILADVPVGELPTIRSGSAGGLRSVLDLAKRHRRDAP